MEKSVPLSIRLEHVPMFPFLHLLHIYTKSEDILYYIGFLISRVDKYIKHGTSYIQDNPVNPSLMHSGVMQVEVNYKNTELKWHMLYVIELKKQAYTMN